MSSRYDIKGAVEYIALLINEGMAPGTAVTAAYEEYNLEGCIQKSILVEEFENEFQMLPYEYKAFNNNTIGHEEQDSFVIQVNNSIDDDEVDFSSDDDIEDIAELVMNDSVDDVLRDLEVELDTGD